MAQIIHVGSSSGEKRASAIFLHGLGGDLYGTWRRSTEDASFWPLWLVEDIPGLSVYLIGYEASVSRWRGTAMHLTDRAMNLLARILAEPALRTSQLILIGHSLGGLVIKQLLQTAASEAQHSAEAASFLTRVEKVAFLATPHTGSDLAAFGNRLRILAKPSAASTCLVRNDPNLRELNRWYRNWANARGISHLTLTETDAIRIFGMVVKPDSGDPGLAGSNPVPIDSDHWTICKPIDRTHDTYVFVRKFIESRFERIATSAEREFAELNAKLDKLVTAHEERGETASAEKAGVSRDVIIQLAQRINADVDDFDQAMLELDRAVAVAVDVVEEGRRGGNTGDFINEVLKRIAEKSAKGQFDEAASEADTAFAQWERDETERRDAAIAGGLKLLDAGLKQDILRRDPIFAAKRIERMVALEYPDDGAARFAEMRKRQDEWYESGRDKGLNFDLQVSIEAARLLLAAASGFAEAGTALIDLGVALSALGQRESDTARLEEAVEIHRAASKELTRERVPLDWAMTQNNLGNALVGLGERESGTARLEEAVDTYRAALQERTRERVPLDWALTQNNLSCALRTLGDRESGTARLEEAVAACHAALQERTREVEPLQWAITQHNLGDALSTLGQRESGTARLEEAVEAFGAALEELTRERVPLEWAITQKNLGTALAKIGERDSSVARLEEAIEAFRAALQEYTPERVPRLYDETRKDLADAVERLEQRKKETAS